MQIQEFHSSESGELEAKTAGFGDKIQALMNDVYDEWRKDENSHKSKWDILNGFSEAHQIAVVFGNFNNQVENGGIEQWIYNGYFHDDAEKLTEYLEVGKDFDERCHTILDRVYKLDKYAKETGCDESGYYLDRDDEDGESHFIGDMINCDAFDSWYYEHCGKDDWWKTVCVLIDKVEGRDFAPVNNEKNIAFKSEEKPSVLDKIREMKRMPKPPHKVKAAKKHKGDIEL